MHLDTYDRFIRGNKIFRDSVRKIVEVLDLQPTDVVATDEWNGILEPEQPLLIASLGRSQLPPEAVSSVVVKSSGI